MSDWFEDTHKGVPRDFPPPLKIEGGKTYVVTFRGEKPKVVIGAFSRKTAVIVVDHDGAKRSLYLSQVDLARQIANVNDNIGSLDGVTVEIVLKPNVGRGYRYGVTVKGKDQSSDIKSLLDVFRNDNEINRRLEGVREIALKKLDLPISGAPERHVEKVMDIILSDVELYGSPDNQQSWDNLVISPLISQLKEYTRTKRISQLRSEGLKVEMQRIGIVYHVVASVRY